MKKQHIIKAFAILATCAFCSCNEYSEDLQGVGRRVEILEDSVLSIQNTVETLVKLQEAMAAHGVVKNIIENPDGTTTLEFLDGRESITFVNNGADGKKSQELLSTRKGEDGVNYWIFGDQWLLDEDGNRISADPKDGKDGERGKDADPSTGPVVMPQLRINENGYWEISTDGGRNWDLIKNDTHPNGIKAVGKNGQEGKPGAEDPIIINASYTDTYIILTIMYNGNVTVINLLRV